MTSPKQKRRAGTAAHATARRTLNYNEAVNQAASLLQAGKFEQAEPLCRDILKAIPHDFNASMMLGILRSQQGDWRGALSHFDQAVSSQPDSYDALFNRAMALQRLGRDSHAVEAYDRVLAVQPGSAESLVNRGISLQALKRHQDAIVSYDGALALRPQYAEALNNRANALQASGRLHEALADYDRALGLNPRQARVLNNRGATLHALQRYEEALASFEQALSIEPRYAEVLNNRGVALQALNRLGDAMASYDAAVRLQPRYADALWNKSLLLLLEGRFDEGWPLYEWRWRRSDAPPPVELPFPLWSGHEEIRGKRVLLHAEQGLGDAIQFCRYTSLVASRGATVILHVPTALKELLRNIEGVSEVVSTDDPLPVCDMHCPLLRLPLMFKTTLATVPAKVPYIVADEARRCNWSHRLGQPGRLRIGLAWSGGALLKNDANRSIPLAALAHLVELPADWLCLQKEVRAADWPVLNELSQIRHFENEIADFSDTAAIISLCDVVICVDTAVAHLAGAMARPVWLALPFAPDWRWLMNRDDSPWYPTARLFRQQAPGDWFTPLQRIRSEIESLL